MSWLLAVAIAFLSIMICERFELGRKDVWLVAALTGALLCLVFANG